MAGRGLLSLFAALVLLTCCANGEKLDIRSLHVRSDIKYRFSTTLIESVVRNAHQVAKEATFDVQLPKPAFISNFSIEIDGVVYPGIVKEKEKARKQYEAAVAQGQSAGHVVEKKSRHSNRFQVSVNVAANSDVSFKLTYQELLQRKIGMYEHVIYVNPGQPVQDLFIDVVINESRRITHLMVPPLRNDIQTEVVLGEGNSLAQVERTSPNSARIRYQPTIEQQQQDNDHGVSGQFVVQYDVERSEDAGQVEVVDGYFVHFFAPPDLSPVRKNVLFVLDTSGSMHGTKIQQVKESMGKILDDLRQGDFFNIITFSNHVSSWRNHLVPVNRETISSSTAYVNNMRDNGATDIHKALSYGIGMLDREAQIGETRLASLIIFLTDGQPTSGITDTSSIIKKITRKNVNNYNLFSLGYGDGVDFEFLQKLSARNRGLARKIYHDSDAALQLEGFYQEIANPVLANVHIKYLDDAVDNATLTNTQFPTFFDGSEIVIAGKLKGRSVSRLRSQITAESANGTLELDLSINDIRFDGDLQQLENVPSPKGLSGFMERLWAFLTIKELLRKQLQITNETTKASLKEKALEMSLKYNFVTPLTSMVATKPNGTTDTDKAEPGPDASLPRPHPIPYSIFARTGTANTMPTGRISGMGPLGYPGHKRYFMPFSPMGNPYKRKYGGPSLQSVFPSLPSLRPFLPTRVPTTTTSTPVSAQPGVFVNLQRLSIPLCFDNGRTHKGFVRLLFDNRRGVMVNALLSNTGGMRKYFEKVWVGTLSMSSMTVDVNKVVVNGVEHNWNRSHFTRSYGNSNLTMVNSSHLTIEIERSIVISISRNTTNTGARYLTVHVTKVKGSRVKGLLGVIASKPALRTTTVSRGRVKVTIGRPGQQKSFVALRETTASGKRCLFVPSHQLHVLIRQYSDYSVKRLIPKDIARALRRRLSSRS